MKYFLYINYSDGYHRPYLWGRLGKPRYMVDIVSVALVAMDGRRYFALHKDFNLGRLHVVTKKHVLPRLSHHLEPHEPWERGGDVYGMEAVHAGGKTRQQIGQEIQHFLISGITRKDSMVEIVSPWPFDVQLLLQHLIDGISIRMDTVHTSISLHQKENDIKERWNFFLQSLVMPAVGEALKVYHKYYAAVIHSTGFTVEAEPLNYGPALNTMRRYEALGLMERALETTKRKLGRYMIHGGRQVGNSTRLADFYIQQLFEERKVCVRDYFPGDHSKDHKPLGERAYSRRLFDTIVARLKSEHPHVSYICNILELNIALPPRVGNQYDRIANDLNKE